MRFHNRVVRLASFFFSFQKTAMLHEAQMLGSHVTGYLADVGQLTDRVTTVEQHLNNPKPVRMCQDTETLSRLS